MEILPIGTGQAFLLFTADDDQTPSTHRPMQRLCVSSGSRRPALVPGKARRAGPKHAACRIQIVQERFRIIANDAHPVRIVGQESPKGGIKRRQSRRWRSRPRGPGRRRRDDQMVQARQEGSHDAKLRFQLGTAENGHKGSWRIVEQRGQY